MTRAEVKAEALARIAKSCATNDLHRCTTELAIPKGRKWERLSVAEFNAVLNELRAEGRIRSINGYWYIPPAGTPKFGGGA